jgi:hypothetical protein
MLLEILQGSTDSGAPISNATFWQQILCVGTAGGFGGAVFAAAMLLENGKDSTRHDWVAAKGAPVFGYFCGQIVVGIGGAMAAIFAVSTVGKAVGATDQSNLLNTYLYLVSLSVVAGFMGNKLLPGVGVNLAKQLTQVENKVDAASKKVDQTHQEVKQEVKDVAEKVAKTTDAMLDILKARDEAKRLENEKAAGRSVDKTKAVEFIAKLTEYSRVLPTNRVLHVVLANLHFEIGDLEEAIVVLETFIKNREQAGITNDDDVATAWFNLACYWTSALAVAQSDGEKKKIKERVVSMVRNCLETAKASGQNTLAMHLSRTKKDLDLEPIRKEGLLDAIIQQFS